MLVASLVRQPMSISLILFVCAALFVVAYSLWEVRSISSVTVGQLLAVAVAAVMVMLLLLLIAWRRAH